MFPGATPEVRYLMTDKSPEVFNEGSMSQNGFDYFEIFNFCFGPLGRIFRPPVGYSDPPKGVKMDRVSKKK